MFEELCYAALAMVVMVVLERLFALRADKKAAPKNAARRMVDAAELVGAFMIAASVAHGSVAHDGVVQDVVRVLAFGTTGALLLRIAGRLGLRLLLKGRLDAELSADNQAAGVVAAGHLLATGMIVASLINGTRWDDLGLGLIFFALAQVTLHVLAILFRALTVYDDAEEILDRNLAAALSYGGVTVAVGIVVSHAAEGEYLGMADSLRAYGVAILVGLALYPVRQILVASVLLGAAPRLRGGPLDRGISEQRDVGLGALEAASYVGTALMVGAIA